MTTKAQKNNLRKNRKQVQHSNRMAKKEALKPEVYKSCMQGEVVKVNERLRILYGFAMVSKINGQPNIDLHGDYITESAMEEAALYYMRDTNRVLQEMHSGERIGKVIFAYPMTTENVADLGMTTQKTGLIIGVQPENDTIFEKFRTGVYNMFSIGANSVQSEEYNA